jgi:hypothetical protein
VGGCSGAPDTIKCDDGDACTTDACTPSGTSGKCSHAAIADGGACDDGDVCTTGDKCAAGKCGGGAANCAAPFWSDDFACAGDKGWVLEPKASATVVGWGKDELPAPPGFKTAACSLNFNNDNNYEDGSKETLGTATSAEIELPAGKTIALVFWSYHGVEGTNSYDKRFVEVSADNFATAPAVSKQLDNTQTKAIWTKVSVDLSKWAGSKVKVRFRFASGDGNQNTTPGWFIDDLGLSTVGG